MTRIIKLPEWAVLSGVNEDNGFARVVVDPDQAYPAWAAELGFDLDKLDQYQAEVLYQCVKLDVQIACGGLGKGGIEIHIVRGSGKWALKNLPKGRGAKAATEGREAREHFKRARGYVPA